MRTELALLVFLSGAAPSISFPEEDSIARSLSALESRYRGGLVAVRSRRRVSRPPPEPAEEEELVTTGIIVSPRGVVLTSAIIFEPFNQVPHGVGIRFPASVSRAEAEIGSARVRTIGGHEDQATFLGRDSGADVAFFQIDSEEGKEFTPVVFEAARAVVVGEEVAVVSLLPEPLGPAVSVELTRVQAVTEKPRAGFVVGTGASDPVGALVASLDGEVLGYLDALTVSLPETSSRNPLAILTMMRDLPKGIGRAFARPASELVDASVDTAAATTVRRGWLGGEMQAVSKELAADMKRPASSGILIGYVYRDSPAEKAGLEVGDLLVAPDDQPVEGQRDEEIGSRAPGGRAAAAGPGGAAAGGG